jgi:hypothetical protein
VQHGGVLRKIEHDVHLRRGVTQPVSDQFRVDHLGGEDVVGLQTRGTQCVDERRANARRCGAVVACELPKCHEFGDGAQRRCVCVRHAMTMAVRLSVVPSMIA